jgi:hypothetical protein
MSFVRPRWWVFSLLTLWTGVAAAQAPLEFGTFHARVVQGGIEYADVLLDAEGELVSLEGYMAPPLKPRIEWFMLTRYPMQTCPYCSDGADWPPDVVLVITADGRRLDARPFTDRLRIVGRLELGLATDVEAGISLIRIVDARVERVR